MGVFLPQQTSKTKSQRKRSSGSLFSASSQRRRLSRRRATYKERQVPVDVHVHDGPELARVGLFEQFDADAAIQSSRDRQRSFAVFIFCATEIGRRVRGQCFSGVLSDRNGFSSFTIGLSKHTSKAKLPKVAPNLNEKIITRVAHFTQETKRMQMDRWNN